MTNKISLLITFSLSLLLSNIAFSKSFTLNSHDIFQDSFMTKNQEYNGFGCQGKNLSPQLSWSGAPKETKAYAIFAYDPDAPTGSGFWHWQIVNIPKDITELPRNAGNPESGLAPKESIQIINDYSNHGFGGACPPKNDRAHRYQFTIYALSKKLTLPNNVSGAVTGYMVKANSLASSTIEALYKRKK